MKIAFCSQMGFVGQISRNHRNMRVEFAQMCALGATHFPLYSLGTDQMDKDYDHIIDYGAVSRLLRQLCLDGEYLLLETLADDACQRIFDDYAVSAIRLTIEKPEAVAEASWVGIQVYRTRP